MIVTEFYKIRDDGIELYKTYSDQNMKIRQDQTGNVYNNAIDIKNSGFTYTETNEEIKQRSPLRFPVRN